MELYTKERKKPKKADFVYKGVGYWVSSAEYHLDWCNSTYNYGYLHTIRDYATDTDTLENDELMSDNEFLEKADKVACRMIPFDESVFFDYCIF